MICITETLTERPPSSAVVAHVAPMPRFERVSRMSAETPHNEWMAVLSDTTEVVVSETGNQPDELDVRKAISIVQDRAHLEARAVKLLSPFIPKEGAWRLLTIDFGSEAKRAGCEFLLCFAFVAKNSQITCTSPYFEVGFFLTPSAQRHMSAVSELAQA